MRSELNSLNMGFVLHKRLACLHFVLLFAAQVLVAQDFLSEGSYSYRADIHFRLDDIKLDYTYLDNDVSFTQLADVIDSIGVGSILSIELISQSSPEGSYRHNKWLTERRAQVVYDSLVFRYTNLEPLLNIRKIAESWDDLRCYVVADSILSEESKRKILSVIDGAYSEPDAAELAMKKSLGTDPYVGDLYKYLFATYYPVIRNTAICITHFYGAFKPVGFARTDQLKGAVPDIYYPPNKIECYQERRSLLAVKTNILYNLFFTPDLGYAPIWNVELELYPKSAGRWSCLLEYEFPWYEKEQKHQYLQLLNLQLEARRYFKSDNGYSGHYLSVYSMANLYDICLNTNGSGFQGEGFGAGVGYGYVLPLGEKRRWKLEFSVKGGFYESYYDPYDAGNPYLGKYYYHWFDDPNKFVERNWRLRYFGPTGVGLSVSYDLITVKERRK